MCLCINWLYSQIRPEPEHHCRSNLCQIINFVRNIQVIKPTDATVLTVLKNKKHLSLLSLHNTLPFNSKNSRWRFNSSMISSHDQLDQDQLTGAHIQPPQVRRGVLYPIQLVEHPDHHNILDFSLIIVYSFRDDARMPRMSNLGPICSPKLDTVVSSSMSFHSFQ